MIAIPPEAGTREFVGRGGLQYTDATGPPAVEVGWAIVPEPRGRGLATELAVTAVEVAFATLHLPELIAFTLPDNTASRRVMEKAGFSYDGEIGYAGSRTCCTGVERSPGEGGPIYA